MKYIFLFLLAVALTACGETGQEVRDGLTAENMKTGVEVMTEVLKDSERQRNYDADDKKPVPPAFGALATACNLLPAAELTALNPCLAAADARHEGHTSDPGGRNYDYYRNTTCHVICAGPAHLPQLPGGTLMLSVLFEGINGPALEEVYYPQYEAGSHAELDELWFNKHGQEVLATSGDYQIRITNYMQLDGTDMTNDFSGFDRGQLGDFLAAVAAELPR